MSRGRNGGGERWRGGKGSEEGDVEGVKEGKWADVEGVREWGGR